MIPRCAGILMRPWKLVRGRFNFMDLPPAIIPFQRVFRKEIHTNQKRTMQVLEYTRKLELQAMEELGPWNGWEEFLDRDHLGEPLSVPNNKTKNNGNHLCRSQQHEISTSKLTKQVRKGV
jgi:hypothetical protein